MYARKVRYQHKSVHQTERINIDDTERMNRYKARHVRYLVPTLMQPWKRQSLEPEILSSVSWLPSGAVRVVGGANTGSNILGARLAAAVPKCHWLCDAALSLSNAVAELWRKKRQESYLILWPLS
jgi:hypothetical protein